MGETGCDIWGKGVGEFKEKVTADELYAGISETWGKTVADIYGERGLARIKRKTRQNPAPWPKHMRQHGRACDKRRAHGA